MKKILSLFLSLVMLLSVTSGLNITAFAQEKETFEYSIQNDLLTITKYNGDDKNVVIPKTINDKKVTAISASTFKNSVAVTSVTIPSTVDTIEDGTFTNCTSLTAINVDKDNKNYSSIDGVLFTDTDPILLQYPVAKTDTSYEAPSRTLAVYFSAFENCSSLKNIKLSKKVLVIGDSAFKNCENLSNIDLGDSVLAIGGSVFENCGNLTKIELPDGVKKIGNKAFRNCRNLRKVTIDGSDIELGDYAFENCVGINSVDISKFSSIGAVAFKGCQGLTSVVWQNGPSEISKYAFSNCENLETVIVDSNVTSVDRLAFYGCNNLKNVTIVDNDTLNLNCDLPSGCTVNKNVDKSTCSHIKTQVVTVDSTCTVEGTAVEYCQICGEKFDTVSVPVKAHIEAEVIDREATCSQAGVKHTYCRDCGQILKSNISIATLAHKYKSTTVGGWEHERDSQGREILPTCTTGSKLVRTCLVCGHTETQDVPALGHNFGSNNKVCLNCGVANPNYRELIDSKNPDKTVYTTKKDETTTPSLNTPTESSKTNDTAASESGNTTKKSANIKKTVPSKKAVTVTWTKVKGAKGYQVQLATDKKFKKNKKTVTIKKQKTTKTTVKYLKPNKKYYVRIRSYKTVNGKKVYSSWSKTKTVKTK